MSLICPYIGHDQAFIVANDPSGNALPWCQPPAPQVFCHRPRGLLAHQFIGLWLHQPDRRNGHTQHVPHLFQDHPQHIPQRKRRAECLSGTVK